MFLTVSNIIMTRKSPYNHKDGSNCWTKNCSRGHHTQTVSTSDELMKKIQDALTSPATVNNLSEGTYVNPGLDVIASREEFDKAIAERQVRASYHPEYPYVILKYSQETQYSKNWNDITMASRGLIFNYETNEIIARPFQKFFNYSEGLTPEEDLKGDFVVAEKLDGSLGITFMNPNGEMEITTAGGFQAPQAAHATKILNEQYSGKWDPDPDRTYLYEIIYPENRIVVNYNGEDDIHLLGAVSKTTGRSVPLSQITEWKWKRAKEYTDFSSLTDIENAPDPGISHEGYIVHFTGSDARVKFKHDEYLKVHRISTGINEQRIHELLSTGDSAVLDQFEKDAPEEFEKYIKETRAKLQGQYDTQVKDINKSYASLRSSLPADVDQKTFAIEVQKLPRNHQPHMFRLFNGRGVQEEYVWKGLKPDFEKGFWAAGNGVKTEDEE